MRYQVIKPNGPVMPIAEMSPGTWGQDKEGHVFYRTTKSAFCVTDEGKTYDGNADSVRSHKVERLPEGTKIILEVEDYEDPV